MNSELGTGNAEWHSFNSTGLTCLFRVPRSALRVRMGFTLLEVLVAVMLSAIIIIAVTGVWISCTRGWSYANKHQEENRREDDAMRRLEELFARVLLEESTRDLFAWKCENQFEGTADADKIQFTTQWPVETGGGHVALVPIRGELRLETPMGAGSGSAKRLVWRYAPFSGDFGDIDQESVTFGNSVQSLGIRYWRQDLARWVDDWTEKKAWPQAVEISVTFLDPDSGGPSVRKFVTALPPPRERSVAPAPTPEPEGEPAGGEAEEET